MLLVRQVFQAKYGRGDELVTLFQELNQRMRDAGELSSQFRILTDASGPFFTVVTETEVESFLPGKAGSVRRWSNPGWKSGSAGWCRWSSRAAASFTQSSDRGPTVSRHSRTCRFQPGSLKRLAGVLTPGHGECTFTVDQTRTGAIPKAGGTADADEARAQARNLSAFCYVPTGTRRALRRRSSSGSLPSGGAVHSGTSATSIAGTTSSSTPVPGSPVSHAP